MKPAIALVMITIITLSGSLQAQSSFDEFLNADCLNGAFIGIYAKDIETDSVIYAHNENLRFSTASNLKLFTSAAALAMLGSDYRFCTSFYINGEINRKGKLKGDLLIVGGGDPLISGRFRNSVTEVLEYWADSLEAAGIKTIEGDLAIDNSFFGSDDLGPGWSYDYLSYWYACPVSALSFNDNCVDFKAYPGALAGEKCQLEFNPPNDYLTVINSTTTLKAGEINTLDYFRHPESNRVEFYGGIAIDDTNGVTDYISVYKPDLYCADIFYDIMIKHGLKLKGEIIELNPYNLPDKYEPFNLIHLFDWRSEPLGNVIKVINKNSQNLFAEVTLKAMGAELAGGGSYKASTQLVTDWLTSIGIQPGDVHYYDGSGLSSMNLATPLSIVNLLQHMYNREDFDIYYESLGIPGVDRSVKKRMLNEPLSNQMRLKTGSIANTRTLSGYLTTKTGRLFGFSILVNHYNAAEEDLYAWMDRLCGYIIESN